MQPHVVSLPHPQILPSPIRSSGGQHHYPRGPRRLLNVGGAATSTTAAPVPAAPATAALLVQSTPSGMLRHRARTTRSGIAAAANGVSPSKRLDFDATDVAAAK